MTNIPHTHTTDGVPTYLGRGDPDGVPTYLGRAIPTAGSRITTQRGWRS
jgi:hypothetical protein